VQFIKEKQKLFLVNDCEGKNNEVNQIIIDDLNAQLG